MPVEGQSGNHFSKSMASFLIFHQPLKGSRTTKRLKIIAEREGEKCAFWGWLRSTLALGVQNLELGTLAFLAFLLVCPSPGVSCSKNFAVALLAGSLHLMNIRSFSSASPTLSAHFTWHRHWECAMYMKATISSKPSALGIAQAKSTLLTSAHQVEVICVNSLCGLATAGEALLSPLLWSSPGYSGCKLRVTS